MANSRAKQDEENRANANNGYEDSTHRAKAIYIAYFFYPWHYSIEETKCYNVLKTCIPSARAHAGMPLCPTVNKQQCIRVHW